MYLLKQYHHLFFRECTCTKVDVVNNVVVSHSRTCVKLCTPLDRATVVTWWFRRGHGLIYWGHEIIFWGQKQSILWPQIMMLCAWDSKVMATNCVTWAHSLIYYGMSFLIHGPELIISGGNLFTLRTRLRWRRLTVSRILVCVIPRLKCSLIWSSPCLGSCVHNGLI